MSLRRLANSLGKGKEKSNGTSTSSTTSWSPSTSQTATPLSSSISLPESNLALNLQRYPSPVQSALSTGAQGAAPLRLVAPFGYNAPPEAVESSSSFGSSETGDSETATLRLKRSLTRILGPKEEPSGHQYHYQKQSLSRKGSKDEGSAPEPGRRSRKGSFFGSSSHLEEKEPFSSDTPTPSSSGTKKIVSWIGQKQSGMTKKVQEALKSGGPSSLQAGMPKSKSRISSELHEDDDEDNRSSTSSAPSFVQTAPEDEVSRILAEPDIMPPLPMQTPFQVPTNVFLPRSHTNLHAMTLASLAFPPSLHPLLYIPNLPAFPRSSNPSSKLPRLPTFRAHLAKTRILDRLEAQDLTPQENESIMPFARHEEPPQPDPGPMVLMEDEESEEGRKITDTPGRSRGLEAWTRRPPALQRFRVWQPDNTRYWSGDGDNVKYEPLSASTPYRTELVITGGTKALAGLVPSSPTSRDWESPNVHTRTLPMLSNATSLSLGSFTTRSLDSPIIDESMLMDASDALPGFTPTRTAHSTHAASASPRPLPVVPGSRSVDAPTAAMAIQQVYWATQEEEHSPIIPVRPLPPRPLPVPPSSPKITVDELESIDGPVIITTTVLTPKTSPRQSMHMSPPGSTNGQVALSLNGMPSSSTITSAPHTPMDPLETASLRRMSMGSMSVVLSGATGFSLEEMDGLEVTSPHDLDGKRRSMASFKTSVHNRRSTASRTSHASSPSLRNHPLPTLSESSRYSESSHLSSRPTYNGSASPSLEAFLGKNHPSTNSGSGGAEQIPEHLLSPVAVVGPGMIAGIKSENASPLEPSRISNGHVDPFLIPQLSSLNTPNGKLGFGINNSSSPIFSLAETERLLSSEPPVLSISVDVRTPTPTKSEQRSLSGPSGQTSPTSSMQSPVDPESRYGIDYDGNHNSTSSAPVRFVKLKRSGSSADSGGTNGTGMGTNGGGRLQRTIKDPSKFWPHNRRVDENVEDSLIEKAPETSSHASWLAERESMQVAAAASPHVVDFAVSGSADLDDRRETAVSGADTVVLHRGSKMSSLATEGSSSPGDISSLPPDLAFDVARLSDTSKLDLTLYTPQKSPPSSKAGLPRRSASSPLSETESASRFADVKEIAATMSPVPSDRNGGHVRTPSSERAARIDAHLASVSASRHRPPMGAQPRPDFLPYPGHNRGDYGHSRQPGDGQNRSHSAGSHHRQSEDGSQASEDQLEDGLSFSPPGYNIYQQRPPVSHPPARWSEASWKERQRSLNTLPLPSASISHSATRPLPYGHVLNRTGSIGGSSAPSIFRPVASKPGTIHGRSLHM